MTKKFEKLKAEFIEALKGKSPCLGEYRKVLSSTTEAELLEVIYNNLNWCIGAKCLSGAFLEKFTPAILLASGIANTGKDNSGLANSGDRNSGDSNSGYRNSGYRNSGDSNSGYSNSGDRNSGDWNSGNRNSGDSNSGNWNSGNRNSGDSNSGYRNSGAFCTSPNPNLILFDVQTDIPIKQWEQGKACQIMTSLTPNIWVDSYLMSAEEKAAHPSHETTGGYLKTIPYKEAWLNLWGNLTEESKKVFTDLPHFDAGKFKEITGITV